MRKKSSKNARKFAAMRAAKERKRLAGPAPKYPSDLPDLRRQIIIKDFDFGEVKQVVNCYKTNRVDCYRVEVDGVLWRRRVGWSKILEAIRKGFPRVSGRVL